MRLCLIRASPVVLTQPTCHNSHIRSSADCLLWNNQSSVWFVEKRNRRVAGHSSSLIIHSVRGLRAGSVVQLIPARYTSVILPLAAFQTVPWERSLSPSHLQIVCFLVRFLMACTEQTSNRPISLSPMYCVCYPLNRLLVYDFIVIESPCYVLCSKTCLCSLHWSR